MDDLGFGWGYQVSGFSMKVWFGVCRVSGRVSGFRYCDLDLSKLVCCAARTSNLLSFKWDRLAEFGRRGRRGYLVFSLLLCGFKLVGGVVMAL